ncbi:hypothetical protein [Streptomyces europaeiscabiei]|uniref:hypothetical protein n=1 Tax=Streptomyces europaeiscabiei TaxID=146819 RepID=UPI002E2C12D9|nr:hypothetical protein [Streptomyces europaeiscabiei]
MTDASRGIGPPVARRLAREGAAVAIAYNSSPSHEDIAERIAPGFRVDLAVFTLGPLAAAPTDSPPPRSGSR